MIALRQPGRNAPSSPSPSVRPLVRAWRALDTGGVGLLAASASAVCALLTGSAQAAQGSLATSDRLGTLFYSAAERAAIVSARQDEPDAPASPSQITVNGIVKRQGGPSTAWINGRAVVEGQPVPPATRLGVTQRGVTLDGTAVRVGESLDLSTRERSDIVAPGAVSTSGKK